MVYMNLIRYLVNLKSLSVPVKLANKNGVKPLGDNVRIYSIPVNSVCINSLRWIKFEEDVEEGGDRWSKPHVATISLHSLFELRSCILNGTVMLDLEAASLDQIVGKCWWRYTKF